MADVPAELFTWTSLGTFTGLTGATVVVTNAISRAVNWNPAWFGLGVALVLCLGLRSRRGQSSQRLRSRPAQRLSRVPQCSGYELSGRRGNGQRCRFARTGGR